MVFPIKVSQQMDPSAGILSLLGHNVSLLPLCMGVVFVLLLRHSYFNYYLVFHTFL